MYMSINISIGSPVVGENFYGRKKELGQVREYLEANNILLAAPRRVGKTSFAREA